MAINAEDRPAVEETPTGVTATVGRDRLRLIKHDKVRIFGFAGEGGAMDTVALVLPKGRADRDLKIGIAT